MKKKKWGRIININTVCFFDCGPNQSAYVSGKGAMFTWSQSVAKELAVDNITVNQIAPGWMRTNDAPDSEHSLGYAKRVPMKRQGDAEEIAKACVFFASDLADFVTGTLLPVSGGMLLA
jgi:3-oxoacyl-[acyl-carrier protein] reductase